MAVWAKNPITGYGVLFFGVLPESRSDYEIELIKENDTPIKVFGRFYGSVEVPERIDKSKAMLELQDGERIKILISGDPKFSPINFDVVDNESIAICSDKEARRAVQVRAIRGVVKNQKSECASSYGSG